MTDIDITDITSVQGAIQLDSDSQLGRGGLQSLSSRAEEIVSDLSKSIDGLKLKSVALGAKFKSPSLDAGRNRKLTIKGGVNATLSLFRHAEHKSLFGDDSCAPPITIGDNQCWMAFELDTQFDVALNQNVSLGGVSGFGVGIEASSGVNFTTYTLFDRATAPLPTLGEAAAKTLSNFFALNSAADLRKQKPGTVHACEVSGTVKLTGSYSFPIAVNKLSLASAKLPFNYAIKVEPQLQAKVSGSLAITGDYIVRCYRKTETQAELGLYKKKGTELSVNLTTGAGLQAAGNGTDLISEFFSAVSPEVDPKQAGLPKEDCDKLQKTLKECVNHSLGISLNVTCSAAFNHEAAILYSIDLTRNQESTDAAIEAALDGDWTLLTKLPNAQPLRNAVTDTHETKHTTAVNLLGIYNYESAADFVRSCTVLHSADEPSITITDKETANRIAVASAPFVADANRLRAAIAEASIATVTYTALSSGGKFGATVKTSQTFLLYKNKLDPRSLHKDLLVAVALKLIDEGQWRNMMPESAAPAHVRIAAEATIESGAALHLFFSDVSARTPRKVEELKQLGRNVLSSLLDRTNPVDDKRWRILNNADAWERMERQDFPKDSPASYSDWYDITFWAEAVSKVGPLLKQALQTLDHVTASDPSKDSTFMNDRKVLADALASVTHKSHAAFELGWPISVMCALSGFTATVSFRAGWDGKTYFDKPAPAALAATAPGAIEH